MLLARPARPGATVMQPEGCFSVFLQLTSLFFEHANPQRNFVQNYNSVAIALQDLVTTGRLKPDASQSFAARVLNALQSSIKQCEPDKHHAESGTPLDSREGNHNQQQPVGLTYPRGAYLWGTIGSGKTMLLDLFCSSFSDADQQQFGLSRLHFHEFMLKIHSRLHSLQESLPRIQGRSQFGLPVYRQAIIRPLWQISAVKVFHTTLLIQRNNLLRYTFDLVRLTLQICTAERTSCGHCCSGHCQRHQDIMFG